MACQNIQGIMTAVQLRPTFPISSPAPGTGGRPRAGRIVGIVGMEGLGITSLEFSSDNDSLVMVKVRTPSYAALVMVKSYSLLILTRNNSVAVYQCPIIAIDRWLQLHRPDCLAAGRIN